MTHQPILDHSPPTRSRSHEITTELIFALFALVMIALAIVILSSLASDAELIMPIRGNFISALALTLAVFAGVAFAVASVVQSKNARKPLG